MSQLIFSLAISAATFWAAYEVIYPRLFPAPMADIATYSLEEIITDLKGELGELSDIPGPNLGLELGDIKIELTTQRSVGDNATVTLAVPVFKSTTLSSEIENKAAQGSTVTVVFAPPKGGVVLAGDSSEKLDLSELVLAARAAIIATAAQPPDLVPKKIDIELNFILVRSRTSANKVEVHVVGLGGGSEVVRNNGNKVSLSFANPAFKKDENKPTPPK